MENENSVENTNMESNNIENRYNEFLKSQIKEYCTEDGYYEVYWDNQDLEAYREELPSILEEYTGKEDILSFLEDEYSESMLNSGWYPEDDFVNTIEQNISSLNDEEVAEYYYNRVNEGNLYDDLAANGYKGLDSNLKNILKQVRIPVNIIVAPYNERNYDMGSIISAFGSDYYSATSGDDIDPEYLDNGITYLVHQQGHSLKELFDEIYANKSNSKLIKSIDNEIKNNPAEAMSGLTILAKVDVYTYGQLVQKNIKDSYIQVDTNAPIGLFNPWVGTGSVFEIELEKPFVFSADEIQAVQLDDVTGSGYYSVSDVYGGFDRDNDITFTSSAPELVQEDLQEVLDYVKEKYGDKK